MEKDIIADADHLTGVRQSSGRISTIVMCIYLQITHAIYATLLKMLTKFTTVMLAQGNKNTLALCSFQSLACPAHILARLVVALISALVVLDKTAIHRSNPSFNP